MPRLGGIENQNRLNYTFNRLIRGLAKPEHPLVVFLDDLQWIDPASLNLIESFLALQTTSNFLIIGAYRDNEVGPEHPLTASRERMRDGGRQVTTITLEDLAPGDTNLLLADTLQLTAADCRALSQVLLEKTAGNPFYFRQQLYALESEKLLVFDREQRRWVWDQDLLHQRLQVGGNVVDLMARKTQTLPVETQRTLSMAACIGSRFKASTLDTVTGRSRESILSDLNPALQSDLIFRSNGSFSFAHDRIQEAGYSLIPQGDLPRMHLTIGRLLLAGTVDEDLGEKIFDIVGHLNAGRALTESESEKLDLAELNLKAGQRARAASAFSDAKTYIEIALDLLAPDSWQGQYELTLSLYNEKGELASYLGQYDQITPIADLIHANARSILERIRIYMVQLEAGIATYDFNSVVEIGLDVLAKLGFDIATQPTSDDLQRLKSRYMELLKGKPDEVVAGLPRMTDERALAASSIMIAILPATFVSRPDVYCVVGFTGGILTLEHGVFPWSPHFIGQMGAVLWVAANLGTPADHVLDALLWIRQMQGVVLNMLEDPFFNLDDFRREMLEYIQLIERFNQVAFVTWTSSYLQAAVSFSEPSEEPHRLIGSHCNEDAYLSAAEDSNDNTGRHFFYAIKLMVSYHFDADNELSELIDEASYWKRTGSGCPSFKLMTTRVNCCTWSSPFRLPKPTCLPKASSVMRRAHKKPWRSKMRFDPASSSTIPMFRPIK